MLLGYWLLYTLSTKDTGQDYVLLLVAKLMLAPKLTKQIKLSNVGNDAVLHCADYGIGQTSTTLQPLGGILPLGKY